MHAITAQVKTTLAHMYMSDGCFIDAVPLLNQCISTREKTDDPQSQMALAENLVDLAVCHIGCRDRAFYPVVKGMIEHALTLLYKNGIEGRACIAIIKRALPEYLSLMVLLGATNQVISVRFANEFFLFKRE